MKSTPFFVLILLLFSCTAPTTSELLMGEWKISTWIDSRDNSNILNDSDAPSFLVRFEKDSVYIQENDGNKTHNYQFIWSISDDSLHVKNLASFKIEQLNTDRCVLSTKTRPFFTDELELHTETLTLMKK